MAIRVTKELFIRSAIITVLAHKFF